MTALNKLKKLLPLYAVIPICLLIIFNIIAFSFTKLITDGGFHYDVSLPIDFKIPFVPAFIVIYIGSFVQWIWGFRLIAVQSKDFCFRIISYEIVAKLICLAIFLIMPTIMVRPEITGNGVFDWLTKLIYWFDTPTNLCPSLHCLESYVIFRASFSIKKHRTALVIFNGVFALLVFASVLFVKQHLFVDIPAAIIVSELGFFIGKKVKSHRVFEKIDSVVFRKGRI